MQTLIIISLVVLALAVLIGYILGKTKRAIRRSGELEYKEFTRLDNNK